MLAVEEEAVIILRLRVQPVWEEVVMEVILVAEALPQPIPVAAVEEVDLLMEEAGITEAMAVPA